MNVSTETSTVVFGAPFTLPGWDEVLPAGAYHLDTDDLAIEGNTRTVHIRLATRIRIHTAGKTVHHQIEPRDLETALQRDCAIRSSQEALAASARAGTLRAVPVTDTRKSLFQWLARRWRPLRRLAPNRRLVDSAK